MGNFKQNNIDFTIENNFQTGEQNHVVKGKLTSLANDYAGYEQDDASKLINAVEIDWNGATSDMGVINTTGELISYLATAYSNAYTAINSAGGADLSTYPITIGTIDNVDPASGNTGKQNAYITSSSIEFGKTNFGQAGYKRIMQINNNTQTASAVSEPSIYVKAIDRASKYNLSGQPTLEAKAYMGVFFETSTGTYKITGGSSGGVNADTLKCVGIDKKIYSDTSSNLHVQGLYIDPLSAGIGEIGDAIYHIKQDIEGINSFEVESNSGQSGYVLGITAGGDVFKSKAYTDSNGVYFNSDINLKENIEQLVNEEINTLFETETGCMYSFDWKDSHEHSFGFIAQEIEEFAPEAVREFDGIKKVNYDVALTKICAAMFKKIKQLEVRITELENK